MAYAKKLTHEQWHEITDNIYWLNLNQSVDLVMPDIIDKWLDRNAKTWWYKKGGSNFWIMGDRSTRVALDLWLKTGSLNQHSGELENEDGCK